jgi:hypothetical protein
MPILVFLGLIKIRELSKKYVYFILFHSLILINISSFICLRKKNIPVQYIVPYCQKRCCVYFNTEILVSC